MSKSQWFEFFCTMIGIWIEFAKIFLLFLLLNGFEVKRPMYRSILAWISLSVVCLLMYMSKGEDNTIILSYVLGVFIPIICFEATRIKKILFYVITFFGISLLDIYIKSFNTFDMTAIHENVQCILNDSISLIMLIIAFYIKRKIKKEHKVAEKEIPFFLPQYIVMMLGIICCIIIIGGTQLMMLNPLDEYGKKKLSIAIVFACSIFFVVNIWLIFVTNSRNYYRDKDEYWQKYISMQDKYFKELLEKDQSLRSFRHDLRSHMIVIKELLQRSEYDEVKKYTDRILDEVEKGKRYAYSGNVVIDAIINDVMAKFEDSNIILRWNGKLPKEMKIDRFDLCTVFSNIIKNAIEACLKLSADDEKIISVDTNIYEGILSVRVANPVYKKVDLSTGRPISDKGDFEAHGFGIRNVEKTIEKYNGIIQYNCDEDEFVVELLMHQNKNM